MYWIAVLLDLIGSVSVEDSHLQLPGVYFVKDFQRRLLIFFSCTGRKAMPLLRRKSLMPAFHCKPENLEPQGRVQRPHLETKDERDVVEGYWTATSHNTCKWLLGIGNLTESYFYVESTFPLTFAP